MIIEHTPNMTGVLLIGEMEEFIRLNEALYELAGDFDDTYRSPLSQGPIRILGFAYEIRHAAMGNRTVFAMEHGMDDSMLDLHSVKGGSTRNVKVAVEMLWPEMLFVCYSLNSAIARFKAIHKATDWDETVVHARNVQAGVYELMRRTVSEAQFKQFKKYTAEKDGFGWGFNLRMVPQFLDDLNVKWVMMKPENREKKLSTFAKRLFEYSTDYKKFEEQLIATAQEMHVLTSELRDTRLDDLEIEW